MDFEELKEQWEELETGKKVLITVFFSGIFVYIIYMFILEPKISQRDNLIQEVENLKREISYLKGYRKTNKLKKLNYQIKSIQGKISQKAKELEKYKKFIPKKPLTDNILISISKMASLAGLSLEKFSIKNKSIVYAVYKKDLNRVVFKNNLPNGNNGIRLSKITFEVNSTGSMKSLYDFVKYLSSSKRLLIVDNINISKIKGNLTFDIVFSSYYMED